jgi:uncharacterized protein YcnI
MEKNEFDPTDFILDDKKLLKEFDYVKNSINEDFVKRFGLNLLKAKFLLDNYIVHHSNEDDTEGNNPWMLQCWQKQDEDGKESPKNLDGESDAQLKLVHLLSMFEVTFSARQRKNYLFYCLLYLFDKDNRNPGKYCEFVSNLADKYFYDIYLVKDNLTENNTPKPDSFDKNLLKNNQLDITLTNKSSDFKADFNAIYGDGTEEASKGIPLFVFNYLDYKLWEKYAYELRGKNKDKEDKERKDFFCALGCSDFDLDFFVKFYFSRTRKSLEHYFPQANVKGNEGEPTKEQINCFGNYAMIGSDANSSGSNWTPKAKQVHYLDKSHKIKRISVASIKFMIMMQKCKDNEHEHERKSGQGQEWNFEDMKAHQTKMLDILETHFSEKSL